MKSPVFSVPSNPPFSLDGGHPSLDFANTLGDRYSVKPDERLPDYRALLSFALASQFFDRENENQLAGEARSRPHEASAIHYLAIALREAIFEVASALVEGRPPNYNDLQIIARSQASAHASGELSYDGNGFRWNWGRSTLMLDLPLWQLADTTVDLFGRQDLSHLRMCAADDCAWLFLDETRNHSRKWCDMSTCGNRAKVARYRHKEQMSS
jgi:predicted RNA-binding Zn ribbon-like protein